MLDPVLLSRLQFAFVIAFHFLLPAFTIGLASYVAVLEGLYLTTRRSVFLRISQFWIRIFAVAFGMGVVSGIVMPLSEVCGLSRPSVITTRCRYSPLRLRSCTRGAMREFSTPEETERAASKASRNLARSSS